MRTLPKLPLGYQDFASLRRDGCVYIDKTQHAAAAVEQGKYFFLSRPRRFGKSLLCSTLKCLFEGRRELFIGLWAEEHWDWSRKHPVVHVDLSMCDNATPATLAASLDEQLVSAAEAMGLTVEGATLPSRFSKLIKSAASSGTGTVVIIDEYDKPILDHITDQAEAAAMRSVLHGFYGVLKGSDGYLRMALVTGISKFARVSLFSALNQLTDLTLMPSAAQLCGYTAEEMQRSLGGWVEKLAQGLGLSAAETFAELERMYDGYWWGAGERMYSPWSILSCLAGGAVRNYWFLSSTPTMLVDLIRSRFAAPEDYEGKPVTDLLLDSYDIDNPELTSLLWQTGYLTIREQKYERGRLTYILDYPNREVRDSWFSVLLSRLTGRESGESRILADAMYNALRDDDRVGFERQLVALFAGIPHQLHVPDESYYHSLFHMTLVLMGADIRSERSTDKGRLDAVVETADRVFVIELKLGTPESALAQIKAKGYHEPYLASGKPIVLVGAGGFLKREIRCVWEG